MSPFIAAPWFFLLCALLATLPLGALYCVCMRGVARRHRRRLLQLAERERVACALHDTLLQNMQGMILRFQSVGQRLPAGSPERATIDLILDQADEVLAEGRHQILALRMPVVYGDNLSRAFAAVGQSLRENFGTPFRMLVTARPVPVDGDRAEEIYGIVREALYNAFQHAQAGHIELELVYGREFFSLYVRDDGKGIAARAPADGDAGYRGLAGMRERAERLGGVVEVMSLPEQGTEVILRVPGRLCYQPRRDSPWGRLAAWLGRTETLG